MRKALAIAALALIPAATALAGEKTPAAGADGLTIGHDGKMWRMEGCAAYPVEAQAGGQSKPVAEATAAPEAKPEELAQSRPVKSE